MLVKDVMEKKVITFKPDDTLKDVVEIFSEKGISGAPVVDEEKRVIGIVTEADIFHTLNEEPREFRMVHMFPDAKMIGLSFQEVPTDKKTEDVLKELGGIKVSEMMKKTAKTVSPEDLINKVIDIMAIGSINRVPVVKDGKLVGIVTRGDIIKGMSKLVE